MDDRMHVGRVVRFGLFEFEPEARQLTKNGRRVHLQDKPFDMLALLLERRGEIVTRAELRQRLWPADTFVVFDDSVNTAVRKLREALGDSANSPRFVETVPRHGYRFIAPIDRHTASADADGLPTVVKAPTDRRVGRPETVTRRLGFLAGITAIVVTAAAIWLSSRTAESPRAGAPRRVMLAVLPFDNLSGSSTEEYFADGMTEELITHLARIDPKQLGVIGRTSSMYFKGARATIAEIGRQLRVDYVLEGSVRRETGRVRVTAQLIRVSDQTHAWADSYDRELADVLAIQRAVAARVAESLSLTLLDRLPGKGPKPAAYEAYLQGRFHWNKRNPADLHRSLELFRRAIESEPTFALAYAGLADAYNMLGIGEYGGIEPKIAAEDARRAAMRAIQLDDSLAEPHSSLGFVRFAYDWDWPGAESEFRRAIELNAGYPTAHHWYANFLGYMGRTAEAIEEIEVARRLDPLSLIINADAGYILHIARRHDEAIERFQSTLKLDPHFAVARWYLGMAYEQVGRVEDAVGEFERAMTDSGNTVASLVSIAYTVGRAGDERRAREILRQLEARAAREYVDPAAFAHIHVALGEHDRALDFLERAYAQRSDWLVEINVVPSFDRLRSNPRFTALLKKMGFP
jgi:TolB-like protein/DNA-binding winged helix-turn-helix (wHTH) protein/Tfp pilus assembly protein PilF